MTLDKEDFLHCKTCNDFTNQLLISTEEDLVIKGGDTSFERFRCGICHKENTRLLHSCDNCEKHTEQKLLNENDDGIIADTIEQKFKCNVCGNENDSWRYSDEHLERFLNARDEENGIRCDYCMANRKQTLLDKQPTFSKDRDFDLTTYKCNTCGKTNYGTEKKRDFK